MCNKIHFGNILSKALCDAQWIQSINQYSIYGILQIWYNYLKYVNYIMLYLLYEAILLFCQILLNDLNRLLSPASYQIVPCSTIICHRYNIVLCLTFSPQHLTIYINTNNLHCGMKISVKERTVLFSSVSAADWRDRPFIKPQSFFLPSSPTALLICQWVGQGGVLCQKLGLHHSSLSWIKLVRAHHSSELLENLKIYNKS